MSRPNHHGVSVAAAAAALALGAALPRPGSAQDPVAQISAECESGAGPLLQGICRDGALTLRALHGGIGLLMTGGGALPASHSTVGRRLPGSPRIVVDLGATWASFSHPGLAYTASGTATEERSGLAGGRATAVIGVFDGFSAVTGVGGILAVDAVAGVRWVRVPDSPVGPGSALGWGGGLRIGVFRESFSLPGVTFSATHDRAGALRYGTEEDSGAWVELEPAVTSFRAIVGKDLHVTYRQRKILYRNRRNGRFQDISTKAGQGITEPRVSRGCAFGDFDNDGRVDVVVNNLDDAPSLLRNECRNGNNWLMVKCIGTRSNRSAIGTRVSVTTGSHVQIDEVMSGSSYYSQNDLRLHFGLGSASMADLVEVRWPSGSRESFEGVDGNRVVTIREGEGIDSGA